MADDQELTVRIRADTGNAIDGTSRVVEALGRIEAQLAQTGVAGTKMGAEVAAGHAVAGNAAKAHAEAETFLGASIGKVEVATNAAARALGALGINAGEASERVLGLGESLEAIKGAALPLVAIGAIFIAIGEAAHLAADGIKSASREQSDFIVISQSLKNQGGAGYAEAREQIEQFTLALSQATTYSRTEATDAIRTLTAAGIGYRDAERLTALATDVAAGSGRSLTEVVGALLQAEENHTRALLPLDVNLRKVIASHGTMQQIVDQMSRDFTGQAAAATNTYAGLQHRLSNEVEFLATSLAEELMPALETGTRFFIGITKAAENAAHAIGSVFQAIGAAGATDTTGFADPEFSAKAQQLAQKHAGGAGAAAGNATYDIFHPLNASEPNFAHLKKLRDELGTHLDYNPALGRTPTLKKEKTPKAERLKVERPRENYGSEIPLDTEPVDKYTSAQKRLDEQLRVLTDSERGYKVAVDLAGTAAAEEAAKTAFSAKQKSDALAASTLLRHAVGAETRELAAASEATKEEHAAVTALTTSYNQHLHAMNESGHATAAQKVELKEIKQALDEHAKALKTSERDVSTLTGELDKNSSALQVQIEKYGETGKAAAAAARAKEAADKKIAETGVADRADRVRALVDEEATYKKSLEQQLAYYQQRYAAAVVANGIDGKESKKYYDEIFKLEGEQFKKRTDAYDTFITHAQTLEGTFADGIVSKHQSMRQSLNDIFKQILADYVKMLEEMILKSASLNGLNATLAKDFGLGGGGGSGAASGVFGGGATAGGTIVSFAPDAVRAVTGSSSGVDSNSMQAAFNSSSSTIGQESFGGWGDPIAAKTTFATRAIGGIGEGIGIGSAASSIFGGNAGNSQFGGALGGILGLALHANPLVGIGIDVAASLLGGLFGNHDQPAKMPDKYDTVNYGQGVANLTGKQAGANGQTFYADTGLLTQTGGTGEISFIEKQLAGAKKGTDGYYTLPDGSKLNPGQYADYLSAFGASATGAGQLNFGKDIGQQFISGASGASNQYRSYKDLDSLAQQFLALPGSSSAAAAAPRFDISRSYPDLNIGTLRDAAGATVAAATGASGSGSMTGAGPVKPIVVNVGPVTIGTVAGSGGLEDLGHQLAEHVGVGLQRIHSGQLPGAGSPAGFGGRQRYRGSA